MSFPPTRRTPPSIPSSPTPFIPRLTTLHALYNFCVAAGFQFEHRIDFSPENADEILRAIPAAPGVFALRGEDPAAEPYLTRTADLRRRLRRLLAPPEAVDETALPSSPNASTSAKKFAGSTTPAPAPTSNPPSSSTTPRAPPSVPNRPAAASACTRLTSSASPCSTSTRASTPPTSSPRARSPKASAPSPPAPRAERYCDAVLDLFKLRRCHEDLASPPRPPRLRLRRNEKMHRTLQSRLHRRGLCRRSRPRPGLLRHPRRIDAHRNRAATRSRQRSHGLRSRPPPSTSNGRSVRAAALLADELVGPDLRPSAPSSCKKPLRTHNAGAPHLASEMWASTEANPLPQKPISTEEAAVFLLDQRPPPRPRAPLHPRRPRRPRTDRRRQLASSPNP